MRSFPTAAARATTLLGMRPTNQLQKLPESPQKRRRAEAADGEAVTVLISSGRWWIWMLLISCRSHTNPRAACTRSASAASRLWWTQLQQQRATDTAHCMLRVRGAGRDELGIGLLCFVPLIRFDVRSPLLLRHSEPDKRFLVWLQVSSLQ